MTETEQGIHQRLRSQPDRRCPAPHCRKDELRPPSMAFWRASNFSGPRGWTYLKANPLLKEPLKPGARQGSATRSLGGEFRGLAFAYIHLKSCDQGPATLDVVYMAGPGHGGRRGSSGHATWRVRTPKSTRDCSEDEEGLLRLFKQFSFPGGIGSHCTPETPGFDPRGRRTGLRPVARLRSGIRQPGSDRLRQSSVTANPRPAQLATALAHQQVPQPDPRRSGPADPAFERVQDQQPDHLGPRAARRDRGVLPRNRLDAVFR